MNIRTEQILKLFVVLVSAPSCTCFAQAQASSTILTTPLAASASTAVPALIPYSGVAVDREGHALSGETGITFLFFKDQNGGEPLFTETQSVVPDSTGRYNVRLGASVSSGIPVDLFGSGETRWLEVQIAGEATQPRTLLTSVPYALKAADATTLGGLPVSAFVLAGSSSLSFVKTAAIPLAITAAAASDVTTSVGGTKGTIPVFTTSNNIENSTLYYNSTGFGIGRFPAGMLDVNGKAIIRGALDISRSADATTTTGYPSNAFLFQSSVYNSSSKTDLLPYFQIQSEPTGNNTASTGATMNVLYYSGVGAAPQETGLSFNPSGIINFAAGQTFPGGIATGSGTPACIATAGGFGSGGTTFVGPSFAVPAGGGCTSWSGFTKTASTVVLTTSGSACLSSDGKKLTLSVSSADPDYLGVGTLAADYIQLTRSSTTGSFASGTDEGQFSGSAEQIACSSSLLQLNENND